MVNFRLRCFSCTKKNDNKEVKNEVDNQRLSVKAFASNRTQVQGECKVCGKKCSEYVSTAKAWTDLSPEERSTSYINYDTLLKDVAAYKQELEEKNKEVDGASCAF